MEIETKGDYQEAGRSRETGELEERETAARHALVELEKEVLRLGRGRERIHQPDEENTAEGAVGPRKKTGRKQMRSVKVGLFQSSTGGKKCKPTVSVKRLKRVFQALGWIQLFLRLKRIPLRRHRRQQHLPQRKCHRRHQRRQAWCGVFGIWMERNVESPNLRKPIWALS
jgi:hypothetical protein